jgi:hypothetical protein
MKGCTRQCFFSETNHRAILGRLVRRHKRGAALGEIGRPGEAKSDFYNFKIQLLICNTA